MLPGTIDANIIHMIFNTTLAMMRVYTPSKVDPERGSVCDQHPLKNEYEPDGSQQRRSNLLHIYVV